MDNTPGQITNYHVLSQDIRLGYVPSKPVFTWLYHILRITLSLIFIWSGISKLSSSSSFAVIIEAYGLIPDILVLPTAILLSFTELIAGLGLMFDIRGSLASITFMLLLFVAILLYGLHLGLDVDCGCFGPEDPESKAFHSLSSALAKDLVLILGIIYLYLFRYIKSLIPPTISSVFNKIKKTRRGNK